MTAHAPRHPRNVKITDTAADPCVSPLLRNGTFLRCGSTAREYGVGGRQTYRCCPGCKTTEREDVTICHARNRWTVATIRAWWHKVSGA